MSAAKHTPGPWVFGDWLNKKTGESDRAGWVEVWSSADESPLPIIACKHHDEMANARLIAAAPDLLRALQDMHQILQEAMTTGGWIPTPVQSSFRVAWADVTSAITKATGEQQ